jgi:hypothetical protein
VSRWFISRNQPRACDTLRYSFDLEGHFMKCRQFFFFALLPVTLAAQEARDVIPLKNWSTPLYWHANQTERDAAIQASPRLAFPQNAVSTDALTCVAVTPCRLVDTRGSVAGFNGMDPFAGPSIPARGTLTISVQSPTEASANTTPVPCGVVPSIAQAYSFNVTALPHGEVDWLTVWPAGSAQPIVSTLNDLQGVIIANAPIVPAGTLSGGISVYN